MWGVNNLYHFENWYTVALARQAVVNAGLPFKIILVDEPFIEQGWSQPMTAFVHDIWQWYLQTYGVEQGRNEAGFTFGGTNYSWITSPTSQIFQIVAEIDAVGLGRPYYWPANMFAFESNSQSRTDKNWTGFIEVHNALASVGAWEPVVVTSTFYNDWPSAYGIRAASGYTGRPIPFLMQWPLFATPEWNNWTAPVENFDNYISFGF